MMNILLIQPPVPQHLKKYRMPFIPLGLAYLGAIAEECRHEVKIVDMDAENISTEMLLNYMSEWPTPNLIGLSVTTWTYYTSLSLAKALKDAYPTSKILLGGPHVTFTSEETLKEAAWVDYIIRGEGETAFRTLLKAMEGEGHINCVSSLSFRQDGEIQHNPMAKVIGDLDSLPFPARHLLKKEVYSNPAIVTSRGCPRRCRFCVAGAMGNNSYRVRSVENVLDELKTLDRSAKILFYDNTFAGNLNHSKQICEAIIDQGLDIEWSCELRVDNIDEEYMRLLKSAGCYKIQFGVESGSPRILPQLGKGITKEQVYQAVTIALKEGLEIYCSFTIGHPEETREDIQQTIDFMRELRSLGAEAQAAIVVPFPGTDLYRHRDKLGITIEEERWDHFLTSRPTFSTRHLSRDDIGQIYFNIMMEFGTTFGENRGGNRKPLKQLTNNKVS